MSTCGVKEREKLISELFLHFVQWPWSTQSLVLPLPLNPVLGVFWISWEWPRIDGLKVSRPSWHCLSEYDLLFSKRKQRSHDIMACLRRAPAAWHSRDIRRYAPGAVFPCSALGDSQAANVFAPSQLPAINSTFLLPSYGGSKNMLISLGSFRNGLANTVQENGGLSIPK